MPTLFEWILVAIGAMKHSRRIDSHSCLDGVDVFVTIHDSLSIVWMIPTSIWLDRDLSGRNESTPSAVISIMNPFQIFQKYIPVVCVFVIPVGVHLSCCSLSLLLGLIVRPQTVTRFFSQKDNPDYPFFSASFPSCDWSSFW